MKHPFTFGATDNKKTWFARSFHVPLFDAWLICHYQVMRGEWVLINIYITTLFVRPAYRKHIYKIRLRLK